MPCVPLNMEKQIQREAGLTVTLRECEELVSIGNDDNIIGKTWWDFQPPKCGHHIGSLHVSALLYSN